METIIYSAFEGTRLKAKGELASVLDAARRSETAWLFFRHDTGEQVDFDLSAAPQKPGPGRPKLGVVSTEVTLLPRHWAWLNAQPGRASGTLRRLVEEAMARDATNPKKKLEALGRILWAVAGNEPGFEEASRALYAGDRARLEALSAAWTGDLPSYVREWL